MIGLLCLAAGCASPPQEQNSGSAIGQQQSQSIGQTGAGAEPASRVLIARQSDITEDSILSFDFMGTPGILIGAGGEYRAYADKCPREGCKVKYENGQLRCPCCGSVFDASSGAVLSGPAKAPLAALQISIIDGNVYASGQ